jgi:hypothetical protein
VKSPILEFEKAGDPIDLQLADSLVDVLGEDKIEESPLLVVVVGKDQVPVLDDTIFPSDGSKRKGNVSEHVENVALLGTNDFADLSELLFGITLLSQSFEKSGTSVGLAPKATECFLVGEEVRKIAEELLEKLFGGEGRAIANVLGLPDRV